MAVAGQLEYLISIDSSKLSSGLSAAEGKVKGFGNKLSAWAVAKGQMIANLASKAVSSTVDFVTGAIEERKGFDSAMSQVAATLGKTVDEMNTEIGSTDTAFGHFEGTLTEFARFMGANTAYTATQAAEALNYMALAGYDTQKSMNMLPNVLNLAAAGNFDLARASDMVTDAQSALGLTTEQTSVLVDQMAKTASKTNTSVEQLGDAMLTVGGTAKQLKGGTRELNAVLGVLADNGIKGSEGGTALRNIMTSLSAPTKKASKALKELGVDIYDSAGNMRSLPDIMGDFNEATKDMTAEKRANILSQIFNKRDLKSIEALLGTTKERWDELNDAITNSEGAAAEMAETQLDNLAGDATKFESALSEAKLALVEGLTPALRNLTQRGTALVQRLTNAFKKDGFKGVVDEAKNAVKDLMKEWSNSENPIKQAIGRIGTIIANGLSWDNIGEVVTIAWNTVLAGFDKLGKIIFGEKADGTTDWPTWDDVSEAATKAWDGIKAGALALSGLVFGKKADGTVDWPDWSTVQEKAHEIWSNIKAKARDVGGIIFGKKKDGKVAWPEWTDVEKAAGEAWEKIKAKAAELGGLIFGKTDENTVKWPAEFANFLDTVERVFNWISQNSESIIATLKDVGAAVGIAVGSAKLIELIGMLGTGGSIGLAVGLLIALFTTLTGTDWSGVGEGAGTLQEFFQSVSEHVDVLQAAKGAMAGIAAGIVASQVAAHPFIAALASIVALLVYIRGNGGPEQLLEKNLLGSFSKEQLNDLQQYIDAYNDHQTKLLQLQEKYLNGEDGTEEYKALEADADAASKTVDELYDKVSKIQDENGKNLLSAYETWFHQQTGSEAGVLYDVPIGLTMDDTELQAGVAGLDLSAYVKLYPDTSELSGYGSPRYALPKAKGDWNVPYDNYLAALHRGEMVLTSSQARKYRDGQTGSLSDVLELIPMIADAVRSGMQGASVNSFLDGNNVTRQTNRITGSALSARRFAPV